MKYYYANAQNQTTGPVTVEQLADLLISGAITRNTNVIIFGTQDWVPLRKIPGFEPPPESTLRPAASPVAVPTSIPLTATRSSQQPPPASVATENSDSSFRQTDNTAKLPEPLPKPVAMNSDINQPTPATLSKKSDTKPLATAPSTTPPIQPLTVIPAQRINPPIEQRPQPQPKATPNPGSNHSEKMADVVALGLDNLRQLLTGSRVASCLGFCKTAGQWLIFAGAGLVLINALKIGIKYNSLNIVLTGVGSVIVIAVLQYIARLFLVACASVNESTSCSLSSPAVPDSIGLLACLASFGILLAGIGGALMTNQFPIALYALLSSVLVLLLAGIALNPSLLQLKIAPACAAEEAMGVLSFFMKLPLVILPLLYFLMAALGVLMSLNMLFEGPAITLPYYLANPSLALINSFGGFPLTLLLLTLALPFVVYVLFLISYLIVDLIRSIVSLPKNIVG